LREQHGADPVSISPTSYEHLLCSCIFILFGLNKLALKRLLKYWRS
jgi:hypothetical protein